MVTQVIWKSKLKTIIIYKCYEENEVLCMHLTKHMKDLNTGNYKMLINQIK